MASFGQYLFLTLPCLNCYRHKPEIHVTIPFYSTRQIVFVVLLTWIKEISVLLLPFLFEILICDVILKMLIEQVYLRVNGYGNPLEESYPKCAL